MPQRRALITLPPKTEGPLGNATPEQSPDNWLDKGLDAVYGFLGVPGAPQTRLNEGAGLLSLLAGGLGMAKLPLINASGESAASLEALGRMRSMANRGEQFVVRRGGMLRPLIGPEAVDYAPRLGEEFGTVGPDGIFQLLQRGSK
jgi:hypothetical protein